MLLKKIFKLDELGTNMKQEVVAGITTFITMAYIIIVNPKILEAAGMPFGASMTATILSAFFGTILMGVYAKRPFAIAPYMGENAFVAYTVVKILGYSWQTALGAIFIGGVLFTLITVLKIRSWLANAIPENMKIAFAVGIGLFLIFIGLNESGIVQLGTPGAPVRVGNIADLKIILSIVCFLLIAFLMYKKIKGAILIGILTITFISIISGIVSIPKQIISSPPDISPIFLKLDIPGALSWGFFSVILTVFVMDFVDTMGTLIGVSYKAGLLDEKGNLPEIEKPMLCDALATIVGALLGTTTTGTYIESAAGIESGGKSGLTAVVTALMFLLALFFNPIFEVVPAFAYGPALIIVGMLMISPIKKLEMNDFTEFVPSFLIIVLMSFTYNLGIGMTGGFVAYPIMKIISGRIKEVHPGLWILFLFSLLFFVFYPY
ncbi:MAG: Xanthine/uracil/thiamine/ascorbate permease family protein [Ignavibacteriae bacterium]|nr:MAG: Xanthine/uracil/thiamine/ascorbate permease family protein [Ignavibacteriota bacterium]